MTSPDITTLVILQFVGTTAGFFYTWFREGRTRAWQLADAKEMALKVNADATAMALKVNTDAIAMAAKVNQDAAVMAAKVIDDAEKIASKVHEAAERLANKVAENTTVSTDAAKEAKVAYTEANTINQKIADFNKQLLVLTDHIQKSEKTVAEEALFNQRVKAAIDEKLAEMNGHTERKVQTRKVR